jgi:hypothetical protein
MNNRKGNVLGCYLLKTTMGPSRYLGEESFENRDFPLEPGKKKTRSLRLENEIDEKD